MRYAARVLLAVAVLALASTGCATLENGTTQRIPVTSDPPGAQVLLDGLPAGVTPTQITVSRRNREPDIEVVMDGFTQSSHRLERREDWATIFWSAFLGAGLIPTVGRLTLPHEDAEIGFWHTIGIFALGVVPGAIDFGSGGAFRFRPDRVDADLLPFRQGRVQPMRSFSAEILRQSALALELGAQEAVRPVQPDRRVLLRDVQALRKPRRSSAPRCRGAGRPRGR